MPLPRICCRGVTPLQVIDNEQVEQAVVVDVNPDRGFGPQRTKLGIVGLIEAGLFGDVGECSVAVIAVERVSMNAHNKEIRETVVVVIAHGSTDIEPGACEPGLFGDVGEDAVSVVAKKAVGVFGGRFLQGGNVCAIGEENIGASIAVIVENGNSARHRFRGVPSRGLAAIEMKGKLVEFETDGGRLLLLA